MRPLELTVEGFRSYRGRATFDWRDRRLVGIVGPIGSGKSSILDAISFALYGKTPQVEGATKALIHQLADQSHVELRFQVNGQVWRAVRSLRRKGASGHQLELLAADEPNADVVETVTLERDMNARIEQLLGMDFKTFCRSVLLAQNRFAEFLKATPAQRDAVLKGVFGFERLDDALRVAKSRLERVEMELTSFEKERERVSDARAGLDQARAAARATQTRLAALDAAGPEIERLEKERDTAAGDAQAATAGIETLEEIVAALPSAPDVGTAIAASRDAGARVADARAAREQAEQIRRQRENELADVASRHGDRERFRSFEHLVQAHERQIEDVRTASNEVARAQAEVTAVRSLAQEREAATGAATAALAGADETLAVALAVVETARGSVMDAKHAEMAHELRGTLEAGESCPVCRQEVHTLPKAGAAPKVAAAEKALARAERDEASARATKERCAAADASARTAAAEASGGIGKAETVLERAITAMAATDATLAATKSQLVEWLGEEGDVRSLFEARQAELTAAEHAVDEARTQVERARSGHEESVRQAEDAGRSIASIANRLSGIWGRLDEDRDVPAEPDTIENAFAGVREEIVGRHERSSEEHQQAMARVEEAAVARAAQLGSLGLARTDDFRRALTEAGVAHGTATAQMTVLEERIAAASDLESRVIETEARRGIAKRLAEDLQPSRFLGFLLEEERAELAELGSDHFEQLTDSAYRFTDDDRFEIVRSERRGHTTQGRQPVGRRDVPGLARARVGAGGDGRAARRTPGRLLPGRGVRQPGSRSSGSRHGGDRPPGLRRRTTACGAGEPRSRDA